MCIVVILCALLSSYVHCCHLMCIVVILCAVLSSYVHFCHLMCIVFILCVLLSSYVYCCHLMCIVVILYVLLSSYVCFVYLMYICCTLYVFVLPYVYLLYYVCIAVLTLDAGLLARSQYPEGPATGHLDTDFSWFPCVYKRMLRWFPSFQVATTCLSCSPPDLNFLVTYLIFVYM